MIFTLGCALFTAAIVTGRPELAVLAGICFLATYHRKKGKHEL